MFPAFEGLKSSARTLGGTTPLKQQFTFILIMFSLESKDGNSRLKLSEEANLIMVQVISTLR